MNSDMCYVGMRVYNAKDDSDGNETVTIGLTGTVVYLRARTAGVVFDSKIRGGHDLIGIAGHGRGWWVPFHQIEPLEEDIAPVKLESLRLLI